MDIYYLGDKNDLKYLDFHSSDLLIQCLEDEVTIIDPNYLLLNGEVITFDYLIIKNTKNIKDIEKLDLLMDDEVIITNYFLQTSQEHIFALNDTEIITEQLQKIVNFLLNIDF